MSLQKKSNIFIGLGHNIFSDKTITQKQIEGLKKYQAGITLSLSCNIDGTNKLETMIKIYYKNPRCFHHKSGEQLGCYNRSNENVKMIGVNF